MNLQTNHLFGNTQGAVSGCGSCSSMGGGRRRKRRTKKKGTKKRYGGCLFCGCKPSKKKRRPKKKKGSKKKKGGSKVKYGKKSRKFRGRHCGTAEPHMGGTSKQSVGMTPNFQSVGPNSSALANPTPIARYIQ